MSVLDKLYTGTAKQAASDILATYHTQGFAVVTFLYFANVMHRRLVERQKTEKQRSYLHALEDADYLLPDGIALQLFYSFGKRGNPALHNLNGTDFTPYFLKQLDPQTTQIILYGGMPEYEQKKIKYFEEQGLNVVHSQHGYEPFDRSALDRLQDDGSIRLFLNARGSPLQEIWGTHHEAQIRAHRLLVLHVGGFFDFISGYETRAPGWMIKLRVLETPRRIITNPSKNLKKLLRMFGIVRYRTKQILSGK